MANERAINVSQATQIARSVKGQLTNINGRLDDLKEAVFVEANIWDGTKFDGVRTAASGTQILYSSYWAHVRDYKTAKVKINPNTAYSIVRSDSSYLVAFTSSQNLTEEYIVEHTPVSPENCVVVSSAGSSASPTYVNFTSAASAEYLYICYTLTGEDSRVEVYKGTYTTFQEKGVSFCTKEETDTLIADATHGVVHTFHEIDSSNYSTYLPTLYLSDLPKNSLAYVSNTVHLNDAPFTTANHAYFVTTETGHSNLTFSTYQEAYDITDKQIYFRYCANGSSWSAWSKLTTDQEYAKTVRTTSQIDASNYSTLLPSLKMADLPRNSVSFVSYNISISDAPVTTADHMYVVQTVSGYSNLINAIFQLAYDATDKVMYYRYSANGSAFGPWFRVDIYGQVFTELIADQYVHTVVNKPISLGSGDKLVIFGDSITTNSHGGFTWGSLIASKLGCTELNKGQGGAQFDPDAVPSITSQVNNMTSADWSGARVVIVAGGTNEHIDGVSPSTFRTNLQNIITTIKTNAPTADIVFITPLKRSNFQGYKIVEVASAICNVALLNKCSVINGADIPIVLTQDENDWILPMDDGDNLHPNADGKWVYAASVLNALF